jgi:hypothetical protein
MTKKPAAGLGSCIAMTALLTLTAPLLAEQPADLQRTINLAQSQAVLAEKMSKELVLVALEVDAKRNLENLESSRALFERTLRGLRDGDVDLGLPGSTNRNFLDSLRKAGELWLVYDATVRTSFESGKITADQVGTVAGLTAPISDAMENAVAALQRDSSEGRLVSLLDTTIELAGRQRFLTQKMSKEFLLIAYGHETKNNKRAPKETIALFDSTLEGLINGDPESRILPPPNREIRAQLRRAARIWDELLPALRTALQGDKVDRETIARMTTIDVPLLEAIDLAISMYESL